MNEITKKAIVALYGEVICYLNSESDVEIYELIQILDKYRIAIPGEICDDIYDFLSETILNTSLSEGFTSEKMPLGEASDVIEYRRFEQKIEIKEKFIEYALEELAPLIQA